MTHKIRTLIVDDEPIARRNLRALLARDPEIEIVGECGSGAQAVQRIRAGAPDLLFLDVQMPGLDGFEVLRRLDAKQMPTVVFVTAYDRHALRAFDVQAIDYLLKPFNDDRFAQALRRAKAQLAQRESGELRRRLLALLQAEGGDPVVAPAGDYEQKFMVRSGSRVALVRAEEIDWIEAADSYTCLHAGGEEHLLRRTMAELEQKLDPERFLRIHRSTIVNLRRLRRVQTKSGEYEVVLEDGTALRLSRSRKEQVELILSRMPPRPAG